MAAVTDEVQEAAASLWHHPDFLKLWAGQTISLAGSQVTGLALPLIAILVLKADALQMGVLRSVQYAPFVLISLIAGVWIDRVRRRQLLIGSDIGRAVLLGSIPVVILLGGRWMAYLYVIGFAVGLLTVIFNIAYQAHLPSLVDRHHLVEGNSKLEASRSLTQVAGPSLGGLFVELFSPPVAIFIDAASFLVSAISLKWIRAPEPEPEKSERNAWQELREGFAFIWAQPLIRLVAASTATVNLALAMAQAVYILFMSQDLAFSPLLLGLVLAGGGAGGLAGAATARHVVRLVGFGFTVAGAIGLAGLGLLVTALAGAVPGPAFPLVAGGQLLMSYGLIVYNVSQFSLWQQTTPAPLRGRVSATFHFIIWGVLPIGSLLGGVIGSVVSLRTLIGIAAGCVILSAAWIAISVSGTVRESPAAPDAGG
ncbi:MAG TPA: MFS transporter [Candidatus Dormibacteraeota bacterium]|nr:MFS transporter [Candidatus Dormibacteraeota bacterium]